MERRWDRRSWRKHLIRNNGKQSQSMYKLLRNITNHYDGTQYLYCMEIFCDGLLRCIFIHVGGPQYGLKNIGSVSISTIHSFLLLFNIYKMLLYCCCSCFYCCFICKTVLTKTFHLWKRYLAKYSCKFTKHGKVVKVLFVWGISLFGKWL